MSAELPGPRRGGRTLGQILLFAGAALGALMILGFAASDLGNLGDPSVIGGLIIGVILAGIPVLAGIHLIRRSPPPARPAQSAAQSVTTETPAAARAGSTWPRLGALRIISVTIGILIILFAGACALVLFSLSQPYGPARWQDIQGVLILAGPPALVGIAVVWAALRAGR